jgi:hypothetical protein
MYSLPPWRELEQVKIEYIGMSLFLSSRLLGRGGLHCTSCPRYLSVSGPHLKSDLDYLRFFFNSGSARVWNIQFEHTRIGIREPGSQYLTQNKREHPSSEATPRSQGSHIHSAAPRSEGFPASAKLRPRFSSSWFNCRAAFSRFG